jgi:hypothetical protein
MLSTIKMRSSKRLLKISTLAELGMGLVRLLEILRSGSADFGGGLQTVWGTKDS